MFEGKYHRQWMFKYRPGPDLLKKGGRGMFNPKNMLLNTEDFDNLPDNSIGVENKGITKEDLIKMYVYKNIPRQRGLCPEEQYSKRWPKLEDLRLTAEPPSMGSTWREEFYPEDYLDPEYGPIHKLLNLKVKEGRLQSRSSKPGGNVQPLTYDQRAIIVCRRLAKSGGTSWKGS